MKIVWSRTAVRDLEHVRAYIAQHEPTAARRLGARIRSAVTALADLPAMGRPGLVGCLSLKCRRDNAWKDSFSANHVWFAPNGRPGRRIVGTAALDLDPIGHSHVYPERFWREHATGERNMSATGVRRNPESSPGRPLDFVNSGA